MNRRRRSKSRPAGRTPPQDAQPRAAPEPPNVYQVRLKGHLDDRWAEACDGLTVTREETGDTLLTIPVVDQAALYGLLRKLRDLGAPLVSINPAGPLRPEEASREENSR